MPDADTALDAVTVAAADAAADAAALAASSLKPRFKQV